MGRLDGKVSVITGGAGGMGTTHANQFIKEGAKVVIADLGTTNGEKAAETLGENAIFVELDVTDESSWKSLVEKTEDTFGPINILVNNAGIVASASIKETSYEDYKKTITVNQDGIFLGMKHVHPSLKKADKGSIVNISSISGIVGNPDNSAYVASKFAVRGLTKAAAAEFGADNIRVNSVHPGIIRTAMTEQEDVQEMVQAMVEMVPLKRLAEPEEITDLVVYLASDESSYSTGTEFIADGGLTQIR
ncbi:SDR family NAD(P)-dependent oxidoreductase [Salinicoccus albus]|uniref:SDR family NAD(P)-dependent oxidoreductase n=1 Tax=Salinicoccus albus TaxID=418756 RepID=UPI00035E6F93|nr:glucose 1-dehydrogenase [Salinicoccus albus]